MLSISTSLNVCRMVKSYMNFFMPPPSKKRGYIALDLSVESLVWPSFFKLHTDIGHRK